MGTSGLYLEVFTNINRFQDCGVTASVLGHCASTEKERVFIVAKFKYQSGTICSVPKCQILFQAEPLANQRLISCVKVQSPHFRTRLL